MKYTMPRLCQLSLMFLCAFVLAMTSSKAHALLLTDSMVFIGPKGGAAVFKLKNTSQKPEAYRLEWEELGMQDKGKKVRLDEGELSAMGVSAASPHMYVAPRRLMLQPGQLQNVRFMLRRNNNMAPGEYRSYITVSPEDIPDQFNPSAQANKKSSESTQSVEITMLTGYRIPVFFLHGDTTLEVSISDVAVVKNAAGADFLEYTIHRSGTRSAIGEIEVTCDDGARRIVANRTKTRVFKELNSREFKRKLSKPDVACTDWRVGFKIHNQDPLASSGYIAEVPFSW